jgi:16S rRNA (cytosine1402-N4)-methyltransferase
LIGREHIAVLSREVCENLIGTGCKVFVDATIGGAGHSIGLLERYRQLHIIGIDRDKEALDRAEVTLKGYSDRATLLRGNFRDLRQILGGIGVTSMDGILFDLGISSYQLSAGRGFSFNDDEGLDMRMDTRDVLTAYEIVNSFRQERSPGSSMNTGRSGNREGSRRPSSRTAGKAGSARRGSWPP